ncbi:MAG: dihydroorotate dehydrogenase electron transfer subunit [Desulfatibacillaceae bacterium]
MSKLEMRCEILENSPVAPGVFRMRLVAGEMGRVATPGQFVMVRCHEGMDPLLRRPFSIHDADPETGVLSLLYKVVGRGTRLLAARNPGDFVDVLGPLGRGFSLSEGTKRVCFLAGGIGVAPMLFLVRSWVGTKLAPEDCVLLLGARTAHELLCREEFARMGIAVWAATQDGTAGETGLVTAMACGMGVCLGCAVRKRPDGAGYVHACVDGPVVSGETLYG